MPFSATRDTENYWRTRYGLPPEADNDKTLTDRVLGEQIFSEKVLRDVIPQTVSRRKKPLFLNVFPSPRRWSRRLWVMLPLAGVAGVMLVTLLPAGQTAAPRQPARVDLVLGPLQAQNVDASLQRFLAEHEASLVALRGYLLTRGEGFRAEWLESTARLQAAMTALEAHSDNWTDGQQLVELVEAKRILAELLKETRAVAAIAGTVNRYPGQQLFLEDIQPALAEAQTLCADVLNAMLAISSPESVGPVGPFAAFRGDMEALREEAARYVMAPVTAEHAPVTASTESFEKRRAMLAAVRDEAPVETRPKIDRLIVLMDYTQEKLNRIFALRAGERWDYADFAFRTRVAPLAERLTNIAARWNRSGV